jgi:tRNA pseudouridine55 synthase
MSQKFVNPNFKPSTPKKFRIYNQISGLFVINKPKDWTSFDVVAKIRNKLNVKKVGHTGTLDPQATGVLVLCVGKGTQLVQKLTGLDKEYISTITFGGTSTTDDIEGEIVPTPNASEVPLSEIESSLDIFKGTFPQIPPNFSAKKIKGKKAYELARKGKEVILEPSQVTVNNIEILDYKWPVLKLKIQCGKGFYVRSLARDLGQKLGVGGYLTGLERTKVGHFTIESAITVEQADEKTILPLSAARI